MRVALTVVVGVAACSGGGMTGPRVVRFTTVSAGTFHSCGVTTTGSAYCWGDDSYGELGMEPHAARRPRAALSRVTRPRSSSPAASISPQSPTVSSTPVA